MAHLRKNIDGVAMPSGGGFVYMLFHHKDHYIGKTGSLRGDGNSGLVSRFRKHVLGVRSPGGEHARRYSVLRRRGVLNLCFLPVAVGETSVLLSRMKGIGIKMLQHSLNGLDKCGKFRPATIISVKAGVQAQLLGASSSLAGTGTIMEQPFSKAYVAHQCGLDMLGPVDMFADRHCTLLLVFMATPTSHVCKPRSFSADDWAAKLYSTASLAQHISQPLRR